jgi:hypothetical protein
MDAGERLYRAGLSTESKATEVVKNAALYRRAPFAAVHCGQAAEAFLILERGKTRLLAEALHLRIPRSGNVPDNVWTAFEQAGAAVRAMQTERAIIPSEVERDPVQAHAVREQAVRAATRALDVAIEHVRVYVPGFLSEINLPAIQALIPDEHSVLVAFCITEEGSIGFVVGQHDLQVVEIPTFTRAELHRHFVKSMSMTRLLAAG